MRMHSEWACMKAVDIPTKPKLHPLFLEALQDQSKLKKESGGTNIRVLDMGCGDGRLGCALQRGELVNLPLSIELAGLDINEEAVTLANKSSEDDNTAFFRADIGEDLWLDNESIGYSSKSLLDDVLGNPPVTYDVVLLQLVISVIGGVQQRLVHNFLILYNHSMLISVCIANEPDYRIYLPMRIACYRLVASSSSPLLVTQQL